MKTSYLVRFVAWGAALCLMLGVTACKPGSGDQNGVSFGTIPDTNVSSPDSDGSSSDSVDLGSSDILTPEEMSAMNSTSHQTGASQNGSTSKKPIGQTTQTNQNKPSVPATEFAVETYGAKGDGKTDDGPAITKAIQAAKESKAAAKIVRFQANKTYRVASIPQGSNFNRLIALVGDTNIRILGNNTKLLLKAPIRVGVFENTSGCEFSGFVIDYSPKPFVLGKVVAKGSDYIDVTSSGDLNYTGNSWQVPSEQVNYFYAFTNDANNRLHLFMRGYTTLGSNKYRLNISSTGMIAKVSVGQELILPVVGASHYFSTGSAFSVRKNFNFSMSNVLIRSLPQFAFDIRQNTGAVTFTNVDFTPDPATGIHLVCWRDGFHVKDNSGKLTWNQCDIGPIGDDAFNLSTVNLKIKKVEADKRTIYALPEEDGDTRPQVKAGDEYVVFDFINGRLLATGKVEKIVSTDHTVGVRLDKAIDQMTVDTRIAFYSLANPGFLIKDCRVEGTVRARCPGTFENVRFNLFWLVVENETYVEGPIPKNILFKNCSFTTPWSTDNAIFKVQTKTRSGQVGYYKCKNIQLQGCTFAKGKLYVEDGNELFFNGKRVPSGTTDPKSLK